MSDQRRNHRGRRLTLVLCLCLLASQADVGGRAAPVAAAAEEHPVRPYVDQGQLQRSGGRLSFYDQPWRGYLETVPATQFLEGVGVNYNLGAGAAHEPALAALAEAGFRTIRLEVPWKAVAWPGDRLADADREELQAVLRAARRHGIRPLVLLNAHHGLPGPHQATTRVAPAGGARGSTTLTLDSTEGLVPGRSGLSNLTDGFWMAEALITSVSGTNVTLSKPLPRNLAPGARVDVATLRYLPLKAVGTPEFDETASGWLRYATLVLDEVKAAGFADVDVEMWNELTFGSWFLDYDNFVGPEPPRIDPAGVHPGGAPWELARRTAELVKERYPGSRVVWGFSNTSFLETDVRELPPGTAAQSYHPYSTGTARIPEDFPPAVNRSKFDFVPSGLSSSMPEGRFHLATSPEQLIQLLEPGRRTTARPPAVDSFRHYMTEHGWNPGENGFTDPARAYDLKAKALVRALAFWLNKGVDSLYLYTAYSEDPAGYGLLPASPPPPSWDEAAPGALASPPLRALRNLTRPFEGAERLDRPRKVEVDVTSIGAQHKVFDGDGDHAPLWYRDMFAFLPFQVTPSRFAFAAYVMSYDFTAPPPPMTFRVRLGDVSGREAGLRVHDPLTGSSKSLEPVERSDASVTFEVEASDYPRIVVLEEDGPLEDGPGLAPWLLVGAAVAAVVVVAGTAIALRRRRWRDETDY